MNDRLKKQLEALLPDWKVLNVEVSRQESGTDETWNERTEIRMTAPSDIPRVGLAGLVVLAYDSPEEAEKSIEQVLEITRQETLNSLPEFLKPGQFIDEQSTTGNQAVRTLTLPLTIMEDAPHMHTTRSVVVRRKATVYVAFGALLENADKLAGLVLNKQI